MSRRVVVIASDRVAPQMAGAGIRAAELARQLSFEHDVVLAAPTGSVPINDDQPLELYEPRRPASLKQPTREAEVVFSPPLEPGLAIAAGTPRRRWIVDLHNPEPFEGLEHQRRFGRLERSARETLRIDRIAFALRTGAAFVCASERQRDMWLGFLAASRRLHGTAYEADRELRNLIDVVPTGLPAEPAKCGGARLKGGIFPADARVVVWHGGIWDWLDPEVVLRAVGLLHASDSRWRLAFTGTGRPSHRTEMSGSDRIAALVRDLGLEAAVYMPDAWAPYDDRIQLVCEADVGVSAHPPTLEARFAFRTRMLDYVWAECPVVCSSGDVWADRIAAEGLGETVDACDPDQWAAALGRVVARGRDAYKPALARVAEQLRWSEVVRPLSRLVTASQPAGGHGGPVAWSLAFRHAVGRSARSIQSRQP